MKCPHCNKEIETECQTFKLDDKEIRIYKWEGKQFKDFKMPKGFKWCEYFDFVKLINEEKIKLEEHPFCYYCKSQFNINFKRGYNLSWVYFNRDGGVYSYYDDLRNSNDYGRVVISKTIKEEEWKQ